MVWLKVTDVAKELSVHPETIKRWIRAGRLVAVKMNANGNWRISDEELRRFIERRKEASDGE